MTQHLQQVYLVRHGETAWTLTGQHTGRTERLRAAPGDALVFSHRDLLRVLTARRLGLHPMEARLFWLGTAGLGILGYDHDPSEQAIRLWNDDHGMREAG